MKLPDAEDMNYWKTGKSTPDVWLERASNLIEDAGGNVYAHAFGKDDQGNAAYMMQFIFGTDEFKIVYPVLPSRSEDEKAAKRQAATLLFHHVKARCMDIKIFGGRTAFFQYLVLPDGRTAAQASIPELVQAIPLMLAGYTQPQIKAPGYKE